MWGDGEVYAGAWCKIGAGGCESAVVWEPWGAVSRMVVYLNLPEDDQKNKNICLCNGVS